MLRIIKRALMAIALVLIALATFLWLGPRETVSPDIAFDASVLGTDLDAYLAATEADFPDVKANSTKEIVWAGAPGAKTDVVVVNLHGFSANKNEIRPIPDRVANALNANLYFARMPGHGRSGDAMGPVTADDWMLALGEAMAIAERLGDKVLFVGTSTGGTLAAAAMQNPEYASRTLGHILVAPNFKLVSPLAPVAALPGARVWGNWVAGPERAWEPYSEAHGANWTTRYPTEAVVSMLMLMDYVSVSGVAGIDAPALFIFNDTDQVVDSAYTREVIADWGGPTEIYAQPSSDQNFSDNHVTMGDIMGPHNTEAVWAVIETWLTRL